MSPVFLVSASLFLLPPLIPEQERRRGEQLEEEGAERQRDADGCCRNSASVHRC